MLRIGILSHVLLCVRIVDDLLQPLGDWLRIFGDPRLIHESDCNEVNQVHSVLYSEGNQFHSNEGFEAEHNKLSRSDDRFG